MLARGGMGCERPDRCGTWIGLVRGRPNAPENLMTQVRNASWFQPVFAALVLVAAPIDARAQWTVQYPPQLASARDIDVLSAVNLWVATSAGELRHTTDGGVNWSQVSLAASELSAVTFATGALGWAGGDGLWRSTDAGQNWTRTHLQSGIVALAFADTQNGIAVTSSGSALRTQNGGQTWLGPVALPGAPVLDDVHALPGGLVWACGAGGMLFTSANGGATWSALASGTTANLRAVHFTDSLHGWICADAQIRATTDGGASWTVQPNPSGQVLEDVFFLTDQRGWAVGRTGARLSTSNGGTTWTTSTGGSSPDLLAVEYADFLRGYASGPNGVVVRTDDGGATWTSVAGGTAVMPPSVWGIDATDAQHAWATTRDEEILRTTDGGTTWSSASPAANFQWNDISFVDDLHGYACGEKQAYFPAVAWTSDGGQSWSTKYFGLMVDFNDVETLSATTALVAGSTFVWRTTDGGLTWPSVAPQPYGTYHGMDFADANVGWIAGTQIFRTDDAGSTWVHQLTPAETVQDVDFVSVSTGFCVGRNGSFLKTIDSGVNWIAGTVPGAPHLNAVSAVDDMNVWVAGDHGFVARSNDGGATWTVEDAGLDTNAYPYTMKFVNPTDGWVGGWTGMSIVARRGTPCVAPTTYCTAKLNSHAGLCRLDTVGTPRAAATDFAITYQGAIANQFGVLVYSTQGRADVPFLGGTRCIALPMIRTGNFSTGSTGAGSRPITITPSMVGTTRWYQVFYRDVQSLDGTGMGISDAVEVAFCG